MRKGESGPVAYSKWSPEVPIGRACGSGGGDKCILDVMDTQDDEEQLYEWC